MPTLTAADWQAQILNEVGAALPDVKPAIDKVAPNIETIWAMWAWKGQVHVVLQYLYARRTALDRIIGQFRNLTNANLGVLNPMLGQKVDRMAGQLRKNFTDDIVDMEDQLARARGGDLDLITKVAPREPIVGDPDPNAPGYRGDALERSSNWPVT